MRIQTNYSGSRMGGGASACRHKIELIGRCIIEKEIDERTQWFKINVLSFKKLIKIVTSFSFECQKDIKYRSTLPS